MIMTDFELDAIQDAWDRMDITLTGNRNIWDFMGKAGLDLSEKLYTQVALDSWNVPDEVGSFLKHMNGPYAEVMLRIFKLQRQLP